MEIPLDDVILGELLTLQNENKADGEIFSSLNLVPNFTTILDTDGTIQFMNRAGYTLLNEKLKNIINRNFSSEYVKANQQKDFATWLSNKKSEKDGSDHFILHLKTKKGDAVSLNLKCSRLLTPDQDVLGFLISGSDISLMMRHYKILERDNKLYEQLAGNIPDVNLFVLDKQMKFIMSVGDEMQTNGWRNFELKGKTIDELSDRKLIEIWEPIFNSALRGNELTTDYKYNNYFYDIWAFPIYDENDKIAGITAITQNVTVQKLVELKLRKSIDEAENANKIKSEFLANISHEIRTPLNAILGFSEQLSQTELADKQEEFVKVISKSSEHLLYLVNDILILSKIEANAIKFDVSPFKIEPVITYIYNTLKIKAEQKNLIFNYDIDPRLNKVLKGDPFRLRQIIINLVNNAIKFTHNGYVEIKCFLMEETNDEIKIRFDVMDTGIGISADKLATIFDQFRQADSRITKKYGGTGLGLTICKNLIEKQNGSLTVKSEEGMGTRFSFVLPFIKGSQAELDDSDMDELKSGSLENRHILLVDDDSVNRLLGKTILEKLNCSYELADSGHEAIKLLTHKKFDAVLLDIHMPEISGIEVARHVRKELKNKDVKLVAVTADVFNEDVMNYYSAGIDDYLIKPYRELELYNKLRKVLKIKSVNGKSTEKVIINSNDTELYNLKQLRDIAEGNNEFIANMLKTFVQNAENATKEFQLQIEKDKWNDIKETAHRILPSFRHIESHRIIDKLTDIKNMTSKQFNTTKSKKLISDVSDAIHEVTKKLSSEIKSLEK